MYHVGMQKTHIIGRKEIGSADLPRASHCVFCPPGTLGPLLWLASVRWRPRTAVAAKLRARHARRRHVATTRGRRCHWLRRLQQAELPRARKAREVSVLLKHYVWFHPRLQQASESAVTAMVTAGTRNPEIQSCGYAQQYAVSTAIKAEWTTRRIMKRLALRRRALTRLDGH